MIERLKELCDDYERYNELLKDPEWRREMQRAVVVEMEVELAKLRADSAPKTEEERTKAGLLASLLKGARK